MPTSVSSLDEEAVDPALPGRGAALIEAFVGDPADSWLGYESCHPLTWLPHSLLPTEI